MSGTESEYPKEVRWSGPPAKLSTALANLGHPEFAAEGATPNAKVLAFGPYVVETVAGAATMFALLKISAALAPPTGVFEDASRAAEGAVGIFLPGPAREIPTLAFWDRFPASFQQQVAVSDNEVVRWMDSRLSKATAVNLDDPQIRAGLEVCVALGYLSEAELEEGLR